MKDTALIPCKKLRFVQILAFAPKVQVEVIADTVCQERMEEIDISQSLLCAGGDSKGVCFVSFPGIFFGSISYVCGMYSLG